MCQTSAIDCVMSIKECLEVFHLKDTKTVRMAILTGRVTGRKLDSADGEYGGTYIVDKASAMKVWGSRISKGGKNG